MSAGLPSEETAVELPLIEQLRAMGWTHLPALAADGRPTGRASFRETILEDRLRAALREINTEDSSGWSCPAGRGTGRSARTWCVFVNGLPLVVIEAKAPHTVDPIAHAIEQLRRYANQDGVQARRIGRPRPRLPLGIPRQEQPAQRALGDAAATPTLVDYVIVHELAHIAEPSHTPTFWSTVERAMPDYEARKSRLAEAGARLWLG